MTDAEMEALVRAGIQASIDAKRGLLDDLGPTLAVARVLVEAYRRGGTMFVFGNGGSAADAQHIAAELVGRFRHERRAFRADALTVNTSILTAISNDYSFDRVYARQLEAVGRPGDVAVGLSTSGKAASVILAFEKARELGMTTVAMTGSATSPASALADHWIAVPSTDTPRIQESHITIGHLWAELIEAALVADGAGG
jgi:D-sedoheptulose 7-phosphate isomerase